MKALLRISKWIGIAFACVLSVLIAATIVVVASWSLQPDEVLNPEAVKLMAPRPAPPAALNAFFVIVGMEASPGLDPNEVGQKIVAEHVRRVAAHEAGTILPFLMTHPSPFLGKDGRLALRGPFPSNFCDISKQKCLTAFQGEQARIQSYFEKNSLLLERYRSIRSYPEFQDPILSMEGNSAMSLSKFVDASVGWRVERPATREEALTELSAEIVSWRRIVSESDAEWAKRMSMTNLYRKYRLASEIMAAYPETVRQYPAILAGISLPIPAGVANLARSLKLEFRTQSQNLGGAGYRDELTAFGKLIVMAGGYKPNATINRYYSIFPEALRLYSRTPGEVLAGQAALSAKRSDWDLSAPNALFYNPMGKIEIGEAAPDYSGYYFHVNDLIGYSRLLDLQRRIVEGDVQPHMTAEFLAGAGADLMDPYTGNSIEWDASKSTISFAGHAKQFAKDGRVRIELARR